MGRRRLLRWVVVACAATAVAVAISDQRPGPFPAPPPTRGRAGGKPLQPVHLDSMFQPGTRFALPTGDQVVVQVRAVGRLRMPSGRLVAVDPGWLSPTPREEWVAPFTAAVRPGVYPVALAVLHWSDDPAHRRVAAAKLTIRNRPVASWKLALRPGQDVGTLREGEFFGFGVDGGQASFFDAAATPGLVRWAERDWEAFSAPLMRVREDEVVELVDADSGANLIAFETGWGDGDYPTWIGRTADGEIGCFIADMLMLNQATITRGS